MKYIKKIKNYLLKPIECKIRPAYFLVAGAGILSGLFFSNHQMNNLEKNLIKSHIQIELEKQRLEELNKYFEQSYQELKREKEQLDEFELINPPTYIKI